jgi:integrase
MHKALNDAARWGLLVRNPADQADPPKPRTAEMKVWRPEQLRTFLEHVLTDRLYAAWLLLATTGMRRGEVLGLRWRDVHLDAGRLSVSNP